MKILGVILKKLFFWKSEEIPKKQNVNNGASFS